MILPSNSIAVIAFASTILLLRLTTIRSSQAKRTIASKHANTLLVPISEVETAINQALLNAGHPAAHARIMCDTMMYAELRGNNQGIVKLIAGAINADPNAKPIKIIRENPVTAQLDGGYNSGMVVVSHAVDLCIDKAKASGIAVVGCSGYASGTGALGVWARKIASQNLVGIVMSQCNEYVAPHGSYEPIFGTNPIAIGVPTTPRSQVLDMATSAYAYFGVVTADKEGLPIPPDVAYDSQGNPTTDPAEAMRGALRVFDRSFKGSHLALMVELLAGALTGAAMTDKLAANNWGSLVIAIDPSMFGSVESFQESANTMCQRVKDAKKLPSFAEELYLPGERGDGMEERAIKDGRMRMSSTLYEQLLALAAK
jgi:L-2-hydroxycarboxylate dehydrogenase (NAD+)